MAYGEALSKARRKRKRNPGGSPDLSSGAQRNALSSASFALPGARRYPIPDAAHARNALARASGKSEEATVRATVKRKYPGIK